MSEAEIALFAGLAGDFSPLTIDSSRDGRRVAPPAMVVAVAVGLGTVDMPVPAVSEWEWLNWKFPRPVRAGDTIYAHWILTQKRPPTAGAAEAIVVWRVDIHTADGALCAEGEVGAKVVRSTVAKQVQEQPLPPRRRRRRSRGNGANHQAEPPPAPPAVAAPPAAAPKPERAAGTSRRRRRRRSSGSSGSAAREEEREPQVASPQQAAAPEPQTAPAAAAGSRKGIGGVLRRLRGS